IRAELAGQLRMQQCPVAVTVLAPVVDEDPTMHHDRPPPRTPPTTIISSIGTTHTGPTLFGQKLFTGTPCPATIAPPSRPLLLIRRAARIARPRPRIGHCDTPKERGLRHTRAEETASRLGGSRSQRRPQRNAEVFPSGGSLGHSAVTTSRYDTSREAQSRRSDGRRTGPIE